LGGRFAKNLAGFGDESALIGSMAEAYQRMTSGGWAMYSLKREM